MSALFLSINFQGNDKLSKSLEKMGNAAKKLQYNIGDECNHAGLDGMKFVDAQKSRKNQANRISSVSICRGRSTLSVPVTIAIDSEQAMADVDKVFDGLKINGKITAEYHQFENQIIQCQTV